LPYVDSLAQLLRLLGANRSKERTCRMSTALENQSLAELIRGRPAWLQSFDDTVRGEQLADDSAAFRGVTGILFAVVSLGFLLMAVTVLIILL
jgi:hypothetical protein